MLPSQKTKPFSRGDFSFRSFSRIVVLFCNTKTFILEKCDNMTNRKFSCLLMTILFLCCGANSQAKLPDVKVDVTKLPPLITKSPAKAPTGMVWIPGGRFTMGTKFRPRFGLENPDRIKHDEWPPHPVEVDGFWMDATEVTNAQYKKFVDATGHITLAEKKPKREDFIGVVPDVSLIPEENLVAGSLCYNENFDRKNFRTGFPNWEYQAWEYRKGANWKHPEGPKSSIKNKMNHPVVHLTYDDAIAYCKWAGKRLPTEAEWAYAARGGHKNNKYPWGNELIVKGKYQCNYWQGIFPTKRENKDGFLTTAPVKSFVPNSYGVYDMAGNVWEWCSDYYRVDYYRTSPLRNPKGPKTSFDPQEPRLEKRVMRGGSYLCNTNNCTGYRVAARMRGEVTSGACHHGFRCVVDTKMIDDYPKAKQFQKNSK